MANRKRPRDDHDDDDDEEDDKAESELEGGRMPFLEHLRELRVRIRNAAVFFILAFVGCWWRAGDIYRWLREPLFRVWADLNVERVEHGLKPLGDPHIVFGRITEPFWVEMSIGLWAGIFAASPFIFYQLWKFIAPGLYKRERPYTVGLP